LVVNGTRSTAFHALLSDPVLRGRSVANLLSLVQRHDYDGIHVDFEAIEGTDRPHLTTFMEELSAAFRAEGKWVTQAIPARDKELNVGWAGAYDYAALGRVNDLVVLMAYGFRTASSATPGPPADLQWVSRTVAFASSLISPHKLLLGVPLYGYDWNATTGPPARALHYPELLGLVRGRGLTQTYDEASQTGNVVYWNGGQRHEVWYEDARTLAAKLNLVEQNLAGAAGDRTRGPTSMAGFQWTAWLPYLVSRRRSN
jgi:spore germination protein YaaH